MKRLFAVVLISLWGLSGCAIFGNPSDVDDTKGWGPDKIFAAGEKAIHDHDYDKAVGYFQKIESRYPHGKYAVQGLLEIAYAYYRKPDPAAAIAAADRFIKQHPHHPNVDYAYYLKGLATFNERDIVEKLTEQDVSDRDPKSLRDSFIAFKDLITRYPDSKYAKDAIQRMGYLVNTLAEHEIHVARYYMQRQAYLAAINRCKYSLEKYPEAPAQEEALIIMISAYDALGLEDYKQDTLRVLQANYPQSYFLTGKAPEDKQAWWKFWEVLFGNEP